jgi:predicted esterase
MLKQAGHARPLHHQHVYVPAKTGASARTLLLLHGTGGDENDLLSLGASLDGAANLLSPRGQILENGMPRFFRRLSMGVFDVEDLKFRTAELAEFVIAAASEYGFDPGPVIAAGYSNGANIAASLMLLRPGVLAGGILLRPMVPLIPETAPDLRKVGVFLAAGRRDPIVRPQETERLAALFKQYGADVSLHWSEQGHELSAAEIEQARRWLAVH